MLNKRTLCTERSNLLDDLNRATTEYSGAANDLSLRTGTLPELEYQRVRANIDQARHNAEQCQTALRTHREEHGC